MGSTGTQSDLRDIRCRGKQRKGSSRRVGEEGCSARRGTMAKLRILRTIQEKLEMQRRVDEQGCEVPQWPKKGAGCSAEGWASRGHRAALVTGQGGVSTCRYKRLLITCLSSGVRQNPNFLAFKTVCNLILSPPFDYISQDFINGAKSLKFTSSEDQ